MDGCKEATGITLIAAPDELLFDEKLNVHGVYLPLSPIGKVNDDAPVGNIFVTPLSLKTPFKRIRFDILTVHAMVTV